MNRLKSAAATLLVIVSTSVNAQEMPVLMYEEAMQSSDERVVNLVKTYVAGLGEGMVWANAKANKTPIFCAPETLALNVDNFIQVLNQQIEGYRAPDIVSSGFDVDPKPIGAILMAGLADTFPCDFP